MRHIVVCLLLQKRDEARELLVVLGELVEVYAANLQACPRVCCSESICLRVRACVGTSLHLQHCRGLAEDARLQVCWSCPERRHLLHMLLCLTKCTPSLACARKTSRGSRLA